MQCHKLPGPTAVSPLLSASPLSDNRVGRMVCGGVRGLTALNSCKYGSVHHSEARSFMGFSSTMQPVTQLSQLPPNGWQLEAESR